MKKLFIFMLLLLSACGYRIAGIDYDSSKPKHKFYVSEIKNSYFESDYYSLLNDEVNDFFSRYGLLASKESADYFLKIDLLSAKTNSSITTISSQAVVVDINIKVKISVYDQGFKLLYEKIIGRVENFNLSSNVSENIINGDEAFVKGIRNLLLDFRYEFENR